MNRAASTPACRTAARDRRGLAAGFGLIELLVTMGLVALVTAFVLPALAGFAARQRLAASAAEFGAALALARSEAVRTGLPVLLLPEAGGAAGNEYGGGWQVVVDADGSGSAGASETVVRRFPALPAPLRFGGDAPVSFAPSGFLSRGVTLTMTLCPGTDAGAGAGTVFSVQPTGLADVSRAGSCP
ncbi:MAG: type fimbrial biosis protein FimT [Pseudomonadota bacterium]|nr:type fimbrial biosis protein FimT [Pseudomonadota bacterium]